MALEGGEGSASRPGHSLPLGKTRYPLFRRLNEPQGRSGRVRKISPPTGIDPRTVQPVAAFYTDYATRPTDYAYGQLCVCACVGVEVQTSTCWTLLATVRLPRHLRFCPAVFLSSHHLSALSLLQGKIRCTCKKCCCNLLLSLKLCKSEIMQVGTNCKSVSLLCRDQMCKWL
jgi:hypothetical protein